MSARRCSREASLTEDVLDLAWSNPIPGGIFCIALIVLAAVVKSIDFSAGAGMNILGPVVAIGLAMIGSFGLLVSLIGLLRDFLFGRR